MDVPEDFWVGLPKPFNEHFGPLLGAALLAKGTPMYVSAAALVTNMSAHFKRGAESSLVWVTSLDRGDPVPDAVISVRDCNGKLYWRGKTDGSGIARISAMIAEMRAPVRCMTLCGSLKRPCGLQP